MGPSRVAEGEGWWSGEERSTGGWKGAGFAAMERQGDWTADGGGSCGERVGFRGPLREGRERVPRDGRCSWRGCGCDCVSSRVLEKKANNHLLHPRMSNPRLQRRQRELYPLTG